MTANTLPRPARHQRRDGHNHRPGPRPGTVIGGVDTHADTHHGAVIEGVGRLLGTRQFPADPSGYRQLLAWMRSFGDVERIGVEGTSSYGASLTRHLRAAGIRVIEVNRPNRRARRLRGKSDPLDAENAARRALSGEEGIVPKDTTTTLESIRVLRIARTGAVKARTAAYNQLKDLLVTAPDPSGNGGAPRRFTGPASKHPGYGPTAITPTTPRSRPSWPCARSDSASSH